MSGISAGIMLKFWKLSQAHSIFEHKEGYSSNVTL